MTDATKIICSGSNDFPQFLCSDHHLGENEKMFKIRNRHRLFTTAAEQNAYIIDKHNAVVKPTDLVWFVGDIVCKSNPECIAEIAKINGRKWLFRGNHDVFTEEQLSPYFERIIPEGDGITLEVDGIKCWVTHYPSQARDDLFNLVGHVHAPWQFQLNMLNVGVDVHHFSPVPVSEISFWFKKVSEFSDDDIYACYMQSNMAYRGLRGTPGVYFKKP